MIVWYFMFKMSSCANNKFKIDLLFVFEIQFLPITNYTKRAGLEFEILYIKATTIIIFTKNYSYSPIKNLTLKIEVTYFYVWQHAVVKSTK